MDDGFNRALIHVDGHAIAFNRNTLHKLHDTAGKGLSKKRVLTLIVLD